MEQLLEKFIRYVKVNTRSDENSTTIPSSLNQVAFQKDLAKELEVLGFDEVTYYEKNSFLIAKINKNTEALPIGFIAHVDTADFNAENINPQIIKNYDGKVIKLNEEYYLDPQEFPNLKNHVGKTLITTDGTTLLGADDKAGVVEIIEACRYFIENKDVKHGDIYVAFGPDEEIGKGADLFDVNDFPVTFAYTMDGSTLGELEYESFNAAMASVYIQGFSIHPGSAKDKMINANKLALEFDLQLPQAEVPEKTSGYEGFYMLYDMNTNPEKGEISYIIRDHDRQKFEAKKQRMIEIQNTMNAKYGFECIKVNLIDQYYNMKEVIEKDMRCVELAQKAMENLGIKPDIKAIRGGTDGSKISFMGIPTPNIFTGGENFHGRYEFACLEVMEQAKQVIIEIIKLNGMKS